MDKLDKNNAKKTKTSSKDPRVTLSDQLTIDVDGILDNDDEVSLETPVTIPENAEPDHSDVSGAPEKTSSQRLSLSYGKDGINSDSAKGKNIQKRKSVIKSKVKSTPQSGKDILSKVNGFHSDNLSDSTSTTSKTPNGSHSSSSTSQKVLKDSKVPNRRKAPLGGQKVEKRIGKAKLSNGFSDVTDANTASEKEDLPSEVDSDQNRPSIQAPWEEKRKEEGKTGSAKNRHKKIDINDLQKDMGNTKSIYQLYFINVSVFQPRMWRFLRQSIFLTLQRRTSCLGRWRGSRRTRRRRTSTGSRVSKPQLFRRRSRASPTWSLASRALPTQTSSSRC